MSARPFRARRGISLIELLTVLGVICIMMSLLFPALSAGRESARSIACRNNLRQIGLALHNYQNLHQRFPIGYVAAKNDDPLRTAPGWSWPAMCLQQLEQWPLSKSIDFRATTASLVNSTAAMSSPSIFVCPSDRESGLFTGQTEDGKLLGVFRGTSFAGNYGSGGDVAGSPGKGNGFFVRNRAFALDDFQDGLSHTFAVGERAAMHTKTAWIGAVDGAVCRITPGAPSRSKKIGRGAVQVFAHIGDKPINSLESDPDEFFSAHAGGCHFLTGDGAVRFVRSSVQQATLRAHASRNGGELISDRNR
jgi:type II secretory pathway pseudopilin PulG